MPTLDELDRRILAALAADSRVTVSALAHRLDVARGTVQARINRLVTSGTIRRFTIEVDADLDAQCVAAVCNIQLRAAHTGAVQRRLSEIDAVERAYTTNGKWDLVVRLTALDLDALDHALSEIRQIPGVDNTETSILLRVL